jgi:phenylacetate-CoA ligase
MDHLIGRSDDMVKLRGTNVYPSACSDAVANEPRANNRWLCVVETVGEGDEMRDEMTVKVEYKDQNIDMQDFRTSLEERLRSDLGVKVTVEPVPADALKEYSSAGKEKKTKYLLDLRGG